MEGIKPSRSWETAKADGVGMEPRDEGRDGVFDLLKTAYGPGHGSSMLGALKGRQTPRENGCEDSGAIVGKAGVTDEEANEVLEGERKSRSGNQPCGKPNGRPRDGTRQGPR